MLNLTDPTLAPLVARYRAWVEAENRKNSEPREIAPGMTMQNPTYCIASYQGFLDWAIREGIKVPKGEV